MHVDVRTYTHMHLLVSLKKKLHIFLMDGTWNIENPSHLIV